jgi:hypothetical protein
MPAPGEHKTVQARILAYAQEIGWTYVPRGEAEERRRLLQADVDKTIALTRTNAFWVGLC